MLGSILLIFYFFSISYVTDAYYIQNIYRSMNTEYNNLVHVGKKRALVTEPYPDV
jgi:hypothetical protein